MDLMELTDLTASKHVQLEKAMSCRLDAITNQMEAFRVEIDDRFRNVVDRTSLGQVVSEYLAEFKAGNNVEVAKMFQTLLNDLILGTLQAAMEPMASVVARKLEDFDKRLSLAGVT